MALTQIADLFYGPLFVPTVIQRTTDLSTIRNSGIVSEDEQIQRFANGGGNIVEMPFWNDLTGTSNVSSDDPTVLATPKKMAQGKDTGIKIRRNNGWSSSNLANSLAAEDPLDNVATLIANYWDLEEQRLLVLTLNGVFAAASMSGHILGVAHEDPLGAGSPVNLDAEVDADAHSLLGDHGSSLVAAMMHSRVYYNLEAQRVLVHGVDPTTGLKFTEWNGKRVIVNDKCPRVAGATSGFKYTTYFFAGGAIGYANATGEGGPKKPVEVESDGAAGNGEGIETAWHRRHWVMHPRGVRFTSAALTGNSPTDAELSTATNWVRVYDPKNVRMVAVTTNG